MGFMQYVREIHPEAELFWVKWLSETEEELNERFLNEALFDTPINVLAIGKAWQSKWNNFVNAN